MINMYLYYVTYDDSEYGGEEHTENGIVCGTSYSEAIKQLCIYYGENAILSVTMEPTPYENGVIPVNNTEVLNKIKEDFVW